LFDDVEYSSFVEEKKRVSLSGIKRRLSGKMDIEK